MNTTSTTSEIVLVTPALAAEWLACNHHNRPILQKRVEGFVAELIAGRWQITADAVAFDVEGVLANGQHRLTAIVRSGIAAPLLVMRGLPVASRQVLDMGAKRTVADILHFGIGMENAFRIVPLCTVLLEVTYGRKRMVSAPAIAETYAAWRPEVDWMIARAGVSRQFFTTGPVLAALVVGRRAYPEQTADFHERLFSGAGLAAGTQVLWLNREGLSGKLSQKPRIALFYMLCNAIVGYASGREKGRLNDSDKGYLHMARLVVAQKGAA